MNYRFKTFYISVKDKEKFDKLVEEKLYNKFLSWCLDNHFDSFIERMGD